MKKHLHAIDGQSKSQDPPGPLPQGPRVALLAQQIKEQGHCAAVYEQFGEEAMRTFCDGRSLIVINSIDDEQMKHGRDKLIKQCAREIEQAWVLASLLPNILPDAGEVSITEAIRKRPFKGETEAEQRSRFKREEEYFTKWKALREVADDSFNAGFYRAWERVKRAQIFPEPPAPTLQQIRKHEQIPRLLNINESLLAMQPRQWLIENLLQAGTITIATGASNAGKTTLLQYLVLCVALGIPFGNRRCALRRVLWIAGEDSHNAQLRVQALADHYGLDRDLLAQQFLILPDRISVLDGGKAADLDLLHQAIRQRWGDAPNIGLIVLDSKSVTWGGENENDNSENARFVAALYSLIERYPGSSLIATHHMSKDKENPTPRGASSLINNADQQWMFTQRPESNVIKMELGKSRMARWESIVAEVKVHELHGPRYEHLRDGMGLLPSVSIAVLTNRYGVPSRVAMKQTAQTKLLRFVRDYPTESKAQLALRMGYAKSQLTKDGRQVGDFTAVEHLVVALVQDKLFVPIVDAKRGEASYAITPAGQRYIDYADEMQAFEGAEDEQE